MMTKLKKALALVAILGLAATGAHATGRSVTVMLGQNGAGIPDTSVAAISLIDPGAPPQFWYGGVNSGGVLITGAYFSAQESGLFHFSYQDSILGSESATNPGIPTLDQVEASQHPFAFALDTPTYIELAFNNGSYVYTGYGYINGQGTLDYITYAAVPEPGTWALMIAGLCLAGGAARLQRRSRIDSHNI